MSTLLMNKPKRNSHGQRYQENYKMTSDYKKILMINEILLSNPDFLQSFRKRQSKTPNKIRCKSPCSEPKNKKNHQKLRQNPSQKNNKITKISNISNVKNVPNLSNNLRELNCSPLTRHVNVQHVHNLQVNKQNNRKEYQHTNKIIKKIVGKRSNSNNSNLSKSDVEENLKSKSVTNLKNIDKNLEKNFNPKTSLTSPKPQKNKVIKKIKKIESLSQTGYSGPGVVKHNQDNFFIFKNLNDEQNVFFIGVCDGHGIFGHDVSKYLINNLPKNLHNSLKITNKYINDQETLYKTTKKVFIDTNKSLCADPTVDTQYSGSTCVTIILTKNKVISANAGDSRAVMGRFTDGEWKNIDLTIDQKPNDPAEKKRILEHGGRIEAYKDENGNDFGPPRVWLKDEDVPGLAMSRSFGDEVAASVGTISEPELKNFEITNDDKFIIIASDGIWEFISSKECVEIVKDFYLKNDPKGCLKHLLNESSKRWIKEEEVIDDITAVLIFFE